MSRGTGIPACLSAGLSVVATHIKLLYLCSVYVSYWCMQLESFVHLHLGIDASGLPKDLECHHLIVNDW
jgi:hypothetical protein